MTTMADIRESKAIWSGLYSGTLLTTKTLSAARKNRKYLEIYENLIVPSGWRLFNTIIYLFRYSIWI